MHTTGGNAPGRSLEKHKEIARELSQLGCSNKTHTNPMRVQK